MKNSVSLGQTSLLDIKFFIKIYIYLYTYVECCVIYVQSETLHLLKEDVFIHFSVQILE